MSLCILQFLSHFSAQLAYTSGAHVCVQGVSKASSSLQRALMHGTSAGLTSDDDADGLLHSGTRGTVHGAAVLSGILGLRQGLQQ
uniref:Putative secreted protein n=1 Tax=Rhipicephalus microplus TaxID=6941 RepID=A0A6M2DAJ1_RHIMP